MSVTAHIRKHGVASHLRCTSCKLTENNYRLINSQFYIIDQAVSPTYYKPVEAVWCKGVTFRGLIDIPPITGVFPKSPSIGGRNWLFLHKCFISPHRNDGAKRIIVQNVHHDGRALFIALRPLCFTVIFSYLWSRASKRAQRPLCFCAVFSYSFFYFFYFFFFFFIFFVTKFVGRLSYRTPSRTELKSGR
jgi:hypothetical protein